jgi:hypothetical protein
MISNQLTTFFAIVAFVTIACLAFSRRMRRTEAEHGRKYANLMYAIWIETLVTFFPFAVYFVVAIYRNDIAHVLQTPELAIAAAVLSGQGLLKLIHNIVGLTALVANRERIVFLATVGLLFFLLSITITALIASTGEKPWFIGAAQLALVTMSLPLYSALAGGAVLLRQTYEHQHN